MPEPQSWDHADDYCKVDLLEQQKLKMGDRPAELAFNSPPEGCTITCADCDIVDTVIGNGRDIHPCCDMLHYVLCQHIRNFLITILQEDNEMSMQALEVF